MAGDSLISIAARAVLLALIIAGSSAAQDYPSKPVRIVTAGVGGSNDFTARLLAQALSGRLGQQVIVDNRSSGVIPAQVVSQATPDGYTLLLASDSLWRTALVQAKLPYDYIKDFSPITLLAIIPNLLVVHPSLPVRSVKDLIALARSRPGQLNYGSGSSGGSAHLAGELFKVMARADIVQIPYKTGALQMTGLISGEVQLMFAIAATAMPYVKSGRLRALAVTGATPSVSLPGIPTVAASGVPDYELVTIQCMFAPAKTPTPIIRRLNQEIANVLDRTDAKSTLLAAGADALSSSPEQLAERMVSDMATIGKVLRQAQLAPVN